VIKIKRFFVLVFSVFNYFQTNAASVIFGSTPLMNEINTIFGKKIKISKFVIFRLSNLDFLIKKTWKLKKRDGRKVQNLFCYYQNNRLVDFSYHQFLAHISQIIFEIFFIFLNCLNRSQKNFRIFFCYQIFLEYLRKKGEFLFSKKKFCRAESGGTFY
jgi:hypothetical protein